MSHYEEKLSSQEVFRGKIVTVNHDRVRLENGREAMREVIHHPGAVVILACEEGCAYFVRQYRYCVGEELAEIPAGKLEPNEDIAEAAARELREETGLTCRNMIYMGKIYPSPGVYGETLHMFFAQDLEKGEAHPDEDEFLTAFKMPLSEFDEKVARGEIHDSKSICIIAMARSRGLI